MSQFSVLRGAQRSRSQRLRQSRPSLGGTGARQHQQIDTPRLVSSAAKGDLTPLNSRIKPGLQTLNLMFYGIWCNEPWVGLNARGPWGTDFDSNTQSAIAAHRAICKYVPKRHEPAKAWTLPHSNTPLLLL